MQSHTLGQSVASIHGCGHSLAYLLPGVSNIPHTAKPEGWAHSRHSVQMDLGRVRIPRMMMNAPGLISFLSL